MSQAGPDTPAIQCWAPDGCCGPSPCAITEDDFICQIRTLLPEGDLWNLTLATEPARPQLIGAVTVGCALVGCVQLVLGSCCDDDGLLCDEEPYAPQLAVVDSFSAVAYQAVQALCALLRELDPCSAEITIRRWGARFGLVSDDPCAKQWPDHVIRALICAMVGIKRNVVNFDYLSKLAAQFGAELTIHAAGDMNCGPLGWWTMARDMNVCPPPEACPPEARPLLEKIVRMAPPCESLPLSLNLVLGPGDIRLPDNCNLRPPNQTLPHDPDLYEAFHWLLPRILPQPVFWCVYERNVADCIQ